MGRQMRSLPSLDTRDPNFVRIKYVRYADDWLIGVIGSHELAEEIKDRVGKFLKDKLALTLSQEKTKITNARMEEAEFLGYRIRKGRGRDTQHEASWDYRAWCAATRTGFKCTMCGISGKWMIESQRASRELWRHSIGNKYRYVRHVTRGYTGESMTA